MFCQVDNSSGAILDLSSCWLRMTHNIKFWANFLVNQNLFVVRQSHICHHLAFSFFPTRQGTSHLRQSLPWVGVVCGWNTLTQEECTERMNYSFILGLCDTFYDVRVQNSGSWLGKMNTCFRCNSVDLPLWALYLNYIWRHLHLPLGQVGGCLPQPTIRLSREVDRQTIRSLHVEVC